MFITSILFVILRKDEKSHSFVLLRGYLSVTVETTVNQKNDKT